MPHATDRTVPVLRLLLCGLAAALCSLPAAPVRSEGALTASQVMARAEQRFSTLADYQCVAVSETRWRGKVEAGTYRVWFKQPHMLRIRVLKGSHRGSEVAVDRGGVVRGHDGGLFRPVVVRLSSNDRRIRSIRGFPVTEFDWGSFYAKYRARAALPGASTTLLPRAGAGAPYDVELRYSQDGHRMRETYRLDPSLWVMVGGDVYADGALVDHVVFQEIRLNPGVSDDWFRL